MSIVKTNIHDMLSDMSGGTLAEQIGHAISCVADGVTSFGGKGKITLTLDLARIGESNQVNTKHTLVYIEPTMRGERREKTTGQTPLYVNQGGEVTAMPRKQMDAFAGQKGEARQQS